VAIKKNKLNALLKELLQDEEVDLDIKEEKAPEKLEVKLIQEEDIISPLSAEEDDDEVDHEEESLILDKEIDAYFSLMNRHSLYDGSAPEMISQVITAYNGLMHVSNIKQNQELVSYSGERLSSEMNNMGVHTEGLMHAEDVRKMAITATINASQGQWMYRDVTMEMKDRFNNWMYDCSNKALYSGVMALIGIGTGQIEARSAMILGGPDSAGGP